MAIKYLHINYVPESGWVLTIMSRLLNSSEPRLRQAFDNWADTELKELGFAITTRMHMLGLCIRRLNSRVAELRQVIGEDDAQLQLCLEENYGFKLPNKDLPYELLLDMDSFIFETRSLYEIVGKFRCSLFQILFNRKITHDDLKSILSKAGIDTRWIDELRTARILFFHETAPWLALKFDVDLKQADPILLKRNVVSCKDPSDLIEFSTLRQIYDGFVNALSELHRFTLEQIRLAESESSTSTK
jgi:hypothetical protein